MQQVKITIEGGVPKVEVLGACGPACKLLTKDLENALGEAKSTKKKAEFYEQAKQAIKAGN